VTFQRIFWGPQSCSFWTSANRLTVSPSFNSVFFSVMTAGIFLSGEYFWAYPSSQSPGACLSVAGQQIATGYNRGIQSSHRHVRRAGEPAGWLRGARAATAGEAAVRGPAYTCEGKAGRCSVLGAAAPAAARAAGSAIPSPWARQDGFCLGFSR